MNPDMYHKSNILQKRDAQQCLEEYGKEIKWKEYGATVIDIGCGDGSVTTSILKSFIPNNYKELVGCDISEKMIEFAIAHHAGDLINFTVLDIGSVLPVQLREKFDHAFSFYTLHWIKDQKIAFSNTYDLLARGGDCLLMLMGHNPMYDVWRVLARTPRWNIWLKDIERFVTPYQDCQDPEKDIKKMITAIGFTNVEVKCLQRVFVYSNIETFKNCIRSLDPFNIPLEILDDLMEDYIKVICDMQFVDHTCNNNLDGTFNVMMTYKSIIVYGKNINGPEELSPSVKSQHSTDGSKESVQPSH